MILVVTANPALDVTYTVPALIPGAMSRVSSVHRRAGGKGINVARVLHALGAPTLALAPCGGADGRLVGADLAAAGLPHELSTIAGPTRRTVTILSAADGTVTLVNEPGPVVSACEWDAVVSAVRRRVSRSSVLVCAGSLPPGVPADGYAELIDLARRAGVPAVLDTSGAALLAGIAAGPALVKPNAEELRAVTGTADPLTGALAMRALGARTVFVSLGAEGMLAVTDGAAWRAGVPRRLRGNTTGAGDAAVAGAALELAARSPWPEVLRSAVSVSSASVLGAYAGDVDLDHHRREHGAVIVEEIHAARVDV
ncbi:MULTISPECIES: 1-phosphofructokinase family hexose kinase [Actinoalloteichus]|uniref:Hexose kinase, 1-phosphofructokinase family n=1 Tax=Actinoalloteichus fjordicus TaxID=1612552 RepID=A0AAC9LFN2_9PSEU|nr:MULTISPECIES: hexose kinase [Actinoalloteichus]APU15990.1 hexose kinase, 1-phosphofructokinase family [Actinoalloteichus fjordicus]APU22054.1 hexose kinase, 1-phosphofructokinase family [Actinoalloteichus sp. GBA129-24]